MYRYCVSLKHESQVASRLQLSNFSTTAKVERVIISVQKAIIYFFINKRLFYHLGSRLIGIPESGVGATQSIHGTYCPGSIAVLVVL